ncbi:MAG: nitroreductase family protein [Candidatus Marinimicrobia bacterium]|nr:nitroreductase family protein [Candidatus Neomarinimicrobiota bacterium]
MLKELLLRNRSYRRFEQKPVMSLEDLKDLVTAARLSPSARNDQPVKFILLHSRKACDSIFPCCSWAGYLKGWKGPAEDERPTSYIIVLGDTQISGKVRYRRRDHVPEHAAHGRGKGYGGCMLGSIDRDVIRRSFAISDRYIIRYVLALGKPSEKAVVEAMENGDTHYYRDERDVHHVPKRGLRELIVGIH